MQKDILNNKILTKEKLIELINSAKQDNYGHWYLEIPDNISKEPLQRVYFGMFYTVCEDFITGFTQYEGWGDEVPEEYKEENTEHYNRHFINDDTFELVVAKNTKKLYCHNCKKLQEVRIIKEERTYKVVDKEVTGEALITYCKVCNSEVYNREAEVKNDKIFLGDKNEEE